MGEGEKDPRRAEEKRQKLADYDSMSLNLDLALRKLDELMAIAMTHIQHPHHASSR